MCTLLALASLAVASLRGSPARGSPAPPTAASRPADAPPPPPAAEWNHLHADLFLRLRRDSFRASRDMHLTIGRGAGPILLDAIFARLAGMPSLERLSLRGDLRSMPSSPRGMPASLKEVKITDARVTQAAVDWVAQLPSGVDDVAFVAVDMRGLEFPEGLQLRQLTFAGCVLTAAQVRQLVTEGFFVGFEACHVGWWPGVLQPPRADDVYGAAE